MTVAFNPYRRALTGSRFQPKRIRLFPRLMDPDGFAVSGPVKVWPVVLRTAWCVPVQASPAGPLTILSGDLNHIIDRHSDAARVAIWARIAAGQSSEDTFANVGYFFPQYSSPAAVTNLIQEVWEKAGPGEVGPSRGAGQFAVVAGALGYLETSTRSFVPRLVGITGLRGGPTNMVALFVRPDRTVLTFYPCGPIVHFRPDQP